MNRREQLLLASFLALLLVVFGTGPLGVGLLGPIRERESRVATLEEHIRQLEIQQVRTQAAQRQLRQWADESLPGDTSVASALYQQWLLELTRQTELGQAIITPNRVAVEEGGYARIPFTVQAEATLAQGCRFLCEFYQTKLLQKITRIELEVAQNEGSPDPPLRLTLHLEALALAGVPSPSGSLTASRHEDTNDYEKLAERNLFARADSVTESEQPPSKEANAMAAAKEDTPPEPKVDAAASVFLVASWRCNQRREAWFYDRKDNRPMVFSEGAILRAANIEGRVLSIGPDFVLLKVGQASRRLELGQNLRQLK